MEERQTLGIKVAVLGSSGTGTRTLLEQLCNNCLAMCFKKTIGVTLLRGLVPDEEYDIYINIWHIASGARWRKVRSVYLRGARAVVLVFEPHQLRTWHRAKRMLSEVRRELGDVPVLLVANFLVPPEADTVTPLVGEEEVRRFCRTSGCTFTETNSVEQLTLNGVLGDLARRAARPGNLPLLQH